MKVSKNFAAILLIGFWQLGITNNIHGQKRKASKEKVVSCNSLSQDREYWTNLLYKISWPVIHNLAEETLQKNMPVELAPGYYLPAKKVTYLEAVGRTVSGIAPWLASAG